MQKLFLAYGCFGRAAAEKWLNSINLKKCASWPVAYYRPRKGVIVQLFRRDNGIFYNGNDTADYWWTGFTTVSEAFARADVRARKAKNGNI